MAQQLNGRDRELEDRITEINPSEQKKERFKNEQSLGDLGTTTEDLTFMELEMQTQRKNNPKK